MPRPSNTRYDVVTNAAYTPNVLEYGRGPMYVITANVASTSAHAMHRALLSAGWLAYLLDHEDGRRAGDEYVPRAEREPRST